MSACAVFLLLCFYTTVVSGDDAADSVVTAAPGDVAILPCHDAGNVAPLVTSWRKDGVEIISGGPSVPVNASSGGRLAVLPDGSLNIPAVERGDEGTYLCATTLPQNTSHQATVLLQVANGPDNVSIVTDPHHVLPNGTRTVIRGSSVFFYCHALSHPLQTLELNLSFAGPLSSERPLASNTGQLLLEYRIDRVQPSAQGTYSCLAHNLASHKRVNTSAELLVYYASERHPECMWTQDAGFVVFHCSWSGTYPNPTLTWTDSAGQTLTSNVSDSLALRINSSRLFEGESLRCRAQHQALHKDDDKSCTFTLKAPYPVGEPLAAALEGTSTTISCSETTSTPPAITAWRRGLNQVPITNGSRYVIIQDGPLLTLTIVNVSREDEGVYFCRSENPLGVRELEVYLTVKNSAAYTGAVIGLFIAVLIVGSAVVIAKMVYSSRHRICLGGFRRMEDDGGDVLSLVESDDEQIFPAAVPRLPPVSNGCQTTLVEIHRIPSTNHDEAETVDASLQQQDNTDKTEEPEDLVTF